MLAIWSLAPLPFLKPAWTSGIWQYTYCWSLARRILSISLLVCEMSAIVQQFEHPLALPFLGTGMKTNLFQSCVHCWVFQIHWHTECSTFTASSFRICSSSTGIPSPPLALFIVMLPKAQKNLVQFSSVTQSCPTLCDPMNCSTPGLPVHHQLPEFTQTLVHRVGDAIQPSHPLSPSSPPALNLSQHQGLFKWVSSSHQVAKVSEFQFQHQSFQKTPKTDLL